MHDFRVSICRCVVWAAMASLLVTGASAQPKPPAQAKPAAANAIAEDPVEKAIRGGIEWLYRHQKPEGHWEDVPRRKNDEPHKVEGAQYGGMTAMATYALLAAGESQQDPRLAKAIAWLEKAEIIGTYAMGMKLQVWNTMSRLNNDQKQVLKKDATLLMNAVKTDNDKLGMYHYLLDPAKLSFDHSCSNYGVLGMWAAGQQNLEVPTRFWEIVDGAWRKNQDKETGGWAYGRAPTEKNPVSMSMTSAGVATLFITQDYLYTAKGGGECKGNIVDKEIAAGIKWMADNFDKHGGGLYALYNIERVGTASGLKYFNAVDWYKQGSATVLRLRESVKPKPDGGWGGVPNTVWAMLFLVKGRAPVMMNKLEYSFAGKGNIANWNQRPRELANLARWTGRALEKDLNWQIVNLKVRTDDIHDAPVLYMSGNQPLNLTKEDKAKLKSYIELGGLVLGHSDCVSAAFNTSFAKLAEELFPQYEFRDLPADHLIYNCHFQRKNWGTFAPGLKGISNGARELMVLIPMHDPARYWQIQNFGSATTKPMAELAANIYLYSVDKTSLKSRFKGHSHLIARNDKIKAGQPLKIARLEYAGAWDPEPGGWTRFANHLHNNRNIELSVEKVKLGDGKLAAGGFKLAHLTGTGKFKLSEAQREELKKFVSGGGTLCVDACGGAAEFKDAAEAELQALFPDAARSLSQPLPADHPLYTLGGSKIREVEYRYFAQKLLVSRLTTPRLRAIDIDGRPAVVYSAEDLSVGLVGMTIDGINGYEPAWANRLMENVIFLAMGQKPAAPKPAGTPTAAPAKPAAKAPAAGTKPAASAKPASGAAPAK